MKPNEYIKEGEQAFKELIKKEIDYRLDSLKDADKLSSILALERATNIVTLVNKIIDMGVDNPADFYEKAKLAYLIAAEKVPLEEKDKVAFPSNFWSMRAKQTRASRSTILDKKNQPLTSDPGEFIKESFKDIIISLEKIIRDHPKEDIELPTNILNKVKDAYSDFLRYKLYSKIEQNK